MNSICEECKYCDSDYEWDDDWDGEIEIEVCRKGHTIPEDNEFYCPDFEKYKPRQRKEEFSECDFCQFVSRCENVIESTTREDARRHFAKGRGYCQKDGGEIAKKNLSEIIQIADKLSFLDERNAVSVLKKAIEKFGDITYGELMGGKFLELYE